ncbi:hypothetical protein BGW80DRAFT_1248441 [Lactifluus volemus]|nr:hypothetical protein BGW80DRAFT_1248441 [Lactifluus volemus]
MAGWHAHGSLSTIDTAVYGRERNGQGATLPQSAFNPSRCCASHPVKGPRTCAHCSPVYHEIALGMEDPDEIGRCPIPGCNKRQNGSKSQEFERHVREHLTYFLYCSRVGCEWRGHRKYLLQDHWRKRHQDVDLPSGEFLIFDPRGLVRQLINGETNIAQANREANRLVRERAIQLGKQDLWVL